VEEQHADHEQDAQNNGWVLGEAYVDTNVSASRYTRRTRGDFARLLEDLRNDDFDARVLILWESSRGSRRVGEWVELVELLEKAGAKVWVHTHSTLYDPANPRHRRALLEDAVDSEYESAKTRDRTVRAKAASAASGRPAGKLLYGHLREYDARGRYVRTVIDPEPAAVVREIARRYADGEPAYAIAADLRHRGVESRRGGGWWPRTITAVATTAAYAGLRVHRGQVVGPADWPAIVDEATWAACAARASNPQRRGLQDKKLKHWLSGAVRCGVCLEWLRAAVRKDRRLRYTCPRPHRCVVVPADWLEEVVAELVIGRMSRPDALRLLAPAPDRAALESAQQEADELRHQLTTYYDLAAAHKLSPAGLVEMEARMIPAIEAAERRAQPVVVPPTLRRLAGPGARQRWGDMTVAEHRESVRLLLDFRVMPAKRRGRGSGIDPDRLVWEWISPAGG
jgi:DNA invertase Pin-like site-specific DNA recombinase